MMEALTPQAPVLGAAPAKMEVEQATGSKIPLEIEVAQKQTSAKASQEVGRVVRDLLSKRSLEYQEGSVSWSASEDVEGAFLDSHVDAIRICDTSAADILPGTWLMSWQVELSIHVFQLSDEGPADAEEEGEEEATPAYSEWQLPATAFWGLWDSLIYEQDVKQRLLQYAATALHFGQQGVDPHLVAFNRTVLLHGPPGTGKTSLCKALAQKLAIRFNRRFAQSQLIEVNAHSLFSKWFSESGKLVAALFARIREVVEEADSLVFVLVDEVESLTAARRAAISGSEPGDAVRAVNALLTALDSLKSRPNVMLLTTSNITDAIDAAFLDRVDINIYLGPPDAQARYEILRSCLVELQRADVLPSSAAAPPPYRDLRRLSSASGLADGAGSCGREQLDNAQAAGEILKQVAAVSEGMSGRLLRKLPFLAHIELSRQAAGSSSRSLSLAAFLECMRAVAVNERAVREIQSSA